MKVDVSTSLNCSAQKAWNELQKSALLLRITWPLARLVPAGAAQFPDRWSEGLTIQCKSYVFGFIPIGVRTLYFEKIDHKKYELQTREHDRLVKTWEHRISVQTDPMTHQAIYRDKIEIDAGLFTLPVWAWANWFYRHRQRKWRALAKTL